MKNNIIQTSLIVFLLFFNQTNEMPEFDKQGHRGSRGTHPENTLAGMKFALENGINTLEMDVVITADRQVILSHEPWFNEVICLDSLGRDIPPNSSESFNIFELSYDQIKKFDCGTKPHPSFPHQKLEKSHKPLLYDIITLCDEYAQQLDRTAPFYNIEIKFVKENTNVFHPNYDEFSDLVYTVIKNTKVLDRTTIQSFDISVLKYYKSEYPEMKLSFLTENELSFEENIKSLGFEPDIYSCYYKSVNSELVKQCHQSKIKVIPWTVNEIADMKALIEMGVDGIITDYPLVFKEL